MKTISRAVARLLLAPFFCVLLVSGFCHWSQAQVVGPNSREARFGKIRLQNALQSANAALTSSAATDFYEQYIKGKTVLINFFYAQCDQGVCDQVMSKLAKVQQLLGDRVGRDRFLVSITLAPTDDTPQALKTYARGIKAKPGWSFLRGSVEEIDDLRKRLGLGKVSPEFIRSLNPISAEVAEAGKTIEAKSPTEWAPKSLRAGRRPGRVEDRGRFRRYARVADQELGRRQAIRGSGTGRGSRAVQCDHGAERRLDGHGRKGARPIEDQERTSGPHEDYLRLHGASGDGGRGVAGTAAHGHALCLQRPYQSAFLHFL